VQCTFRHLKPHVGEQFSRILWAILSRCPSSLVYHRASGRTSNSQKSQRQLALDVNEEKVLIDWTFQLHRLGVPTTPSRLRAMANHVHRARAKTELHLLGPNWVTCFIARHPEIKSVMSSRLDKDRWDNITRERGVGLISSRKSKRSSESSIASLQHGRKRLCFGRFRKSPSPYPI
jgi:hypothetical protein